MHNVRVAIGSALSTTSVVSIGVSIEEVKQLIDQDNKDRCAFFKHFKYDVCDKIGEVSSSLTIHTDMTNL